MSRMIDYNQIEISPGFYAKKCLWTLLRGLFLLSMSFVILYPLLYMASMAFRSAEDFYDVTVVWLPKNWTLENLKFAILDAELLNAMGHTFFIAVVSSLLQVMITSLAGYGFARFRFKGNKILFALAIFTIIIPPQMMNIPNHLLMKNFDFFGVIRLLTGAPSSIHLLDSPLAFFLPAVLGQGLRAGVFILVFRQFYSGLSAELEEAALIDGCGYRKTFFRVMLPNATTPMMVSFLFSVVWYWNDYYMSFTYLSSYRTLAVQLMDLRERLATLLPYEKQTAYYIIPIEQAACLFSILPLLLLFLVGQKFFVQGIDKTGIVG